LQPLKTEINGHVFNRPWVLAPYIGRQHYFYFSIMSREEDVLLCYMYHDSMYSRRY